jgi:hypothetical protein
MQKRLQLKAKERSLLLDRWQESGKSIRQFCEDEKISYHAFHYWRKRLKREKTSGFIKLQPVDSALPAAVSYCKVTLANGNCVLFHQSPGAKILRNLLRIVG